MLLYAWLSKILVKGRNEKLKEDLWKYSRVP